MFSVLRVAKSVDEVSDVVSGMRTVEQIRPKANTLSCDYRKGECIFFRARTLEIIHCAWITVPEVGLDKDGAGTVQCLASFLVAVDA